MNWEAIGAVGEVGGAIAVVATLAYLAAQIRQSNQLERNESHRTGFAIGTRQCWRRCWTRSSQIWLAVVCEILTSSLAPKNRRSMPNWGGAFFLIEELHILGVRGDLDEDVVTTAETIAYGSLDREEEIQFHSLATQLLTTYTRSRIFLSEGTLDREVFDSTERWMTAFLNTSGGGSWWARANRDWIAWAEDLSGQSVFPDRHPLASQPPVSGKGF